MNLDGFSMRPLTLELAKILIGGRVDKITQQNKANLTITIRTLGQSYLLRISVAPQNPSIHIVQKSPENLPEPPTFCMVLRKNLENGRIADIRQFELDRIIFIDVDTIGAGGKIQTLTLAVELIGKYSNIILISDGKIIDALKKVGTNSSRVRTVLPNQIYQMPPVQNKLDIFSCNVSEIISQIKADENLRLDKAVMNVCQGFGPQSVKETIFSAGLPTVFPVSAGAASLLFGPCCFAACFVCSFGALTCGGTAFFVFCASVVFATALWEPLFCFLAAGFSLCSLAKILLTTL